MQTAKIEKEKQFTSRINKLYRDTLGEGAQFSLQTSLDPIILDESQLRGFQDRYNSIKKYQKITCDLFRESLYESGLTYVRNLILGDVNPMFGAEFHKSMYEADSDTPTFFRTDESKMGKITEIQTIGSGWGNVDLLQRAIPIQEELIGKSLPKRAHNSVSFAEKFASQVRSLIPGEPRIFHLIDNSSNMFNTNYFIERTRECGLVYQGRDSEVSFKNVNFVRSHSFIGEVTQIEFNNFFSKYADRELVFDLPPNVVFEQKLPIMLPFWQKTKHLYPDEVREIFPFTSLVEEEYLTLEDGSKPTFDEFSKYSSTRRDYYLKYAGPNEQRNWGSKSVYSLSRCTKETCRELLQKASDDGKTRNFWIIQKGEYMKEHVNRQQDESSGGLDLHSRYSGFYGPDGFMSGIVFNRNFYKVHGQADTIIRLLL